MNLRLLQISDSALPIGGYTHSWGLEAAIARGLARDAESLERFVRSWLRHALGPLEGVVVTASCRAAADNDWPALAEANNLLTASIAPPSIRGASCELGEQLLSLASTWVWSIAGIRAFQTEAPCGHDWRRWNHPVVFGLLGSIAGGSPVETLQAYLHQAVMGMIGAGVRAIPVGHTHGQQMTAYLHEEITELAAEFSRRPLHSAGSHSTRSCAMSRHGFIPGFSARDGFRDVLFAPGSARRRSCCPFPRHKGDHPHEHPHDHDYMGRPGPARYAATRRKTFTLGVAGPVGSGKTALVERLCRELWPEINLAVITNDIYTHEDAEFLSRRKVLPLERIVGVQTGGCPHTAIRDDASSNLSTIANFERMFPDLQMVIVESGGDNLTAVFSRELADVFIFVIDVAEGDKIPRKGGPGICTSDLLVVNKTDLAAHVGADLEVMRRDSLRMRGDRAVYLISLRQGDGVEDVVRWVREQFASRPKTS